MNTLPDFAEGHVFVVGASGGVGSAVCELFAREGCNVAVMYRSNTAKAQQAYERVLGHGRSALMSQVDLQNTTSIISALADAEKILGPVHTVVYAAGPSLPLKYLSNVEPDEMRRYLVDDTLAFFNLAHSALPYLRRSSGSIVAIHTTGLYRWPLKDGLSVVPKAGVDAMIKGFAKEEARNGVRVNGVALGVLDSGLFDKLRESGDMDDRFVAETIRIVPMRRLGKVEEVAEATLFLASRRASYTTGQSIVVDGGFHL